MFVPSTTDTTGKSKNEPSKNEFVSSRTAKSPPLPDAELSEVTQQNFNEISSHTSDNNCVEDTSRIVAKTNEAIAPVDETRHTITCTTPDDNDPKKQQVWLAKVHEAIMPHKLSISGNVEEPSDASTSDDFEVMENVGPKVDRHMEWLTAVRSSIQDYKNQYQ